MKIAKIKNSGTQGVESGALDAAKKVGVPITGWKAKNDECKYPEIKGTPSTKPEQKLIWNVRDSHATLVIDFGAVSDDTDLEYEVAEAYGRPILISTKPEEITLWLNSLGEEITLNVIGPNENEFPGASKKTKLIMDKVFEYYNRMLI